jgi:hypothetical protein
MSTTIYGFREIDLLGVAYADNDNFVYSQELGIKTKFGVNSLDCNPYGHHHIKLRNAGDYCTWSYIQTSVQNVLIGPVWIEHFGDFEIKSHKTGIGFEISRFRN